jgi:hypothetical protein
LWLCAMSSAQDRQYEQEGYPQWRLSSSGLP